MQAIRGKALGPVASMLAIGAAARLVADAQSAERQALPAVPITFDTDIGTDMDDAGALAILHIMADRGEAPILATMSANSNCWCAPALDLPPHCSGPRRGAYYPEHHPASGTPVDQSTCSAYIRRTFGIHRTHRSRRPVTRLFAFC